MSTAAARNRHDEVERCPVSSWITLSAITRMVTVAPLTRYVPPFLNRRRDPTYFSVHGATLIWMIIRWLGAFPAQQRHVSSSACAMRSAASLTSAFSQQGEPPILPVFQAGSLMELTGLACAQARLVFKFPAMSAGSPQFHKLKRPQRKRSRPRKVSSFKYIIAELKERGVDAREAERTLAQLSACLRTIEDQWLALWKEQP